MTSITNKIYADTVDAFREACKRAGIPPTARQASKFRNHQGIAWQHRNGASAAKQPECICGADNPQNNGLRFDVLCPKHDGSIKLVGRAHLDGKDETL